MLNAKVLIQPDEGGQFHGKVIGHSFIGSPGSRGSRSFLMVEVGEEIHSDDLQWDAPVQRTIADAIRGHKHVWVSESDANYLLELGLVPTKGGEKLRSKSFGMFNGIKVNVDTNLMQGEYYTLDGKRHRV